MSIAVLDKAFSILEVFARAGRALSLAELAEESRLPKPTVHRILRSLRDLGYVTPAEARGSYALSERLSSLKAYGRDAALRIVAQPLMDELHQRFDETVNLGVLEGIYVRYAHVTETAQALRWIVKPGARDLFHTTALGRSIVAHLPYEQQSRLVAKVCAEIPTRQRLEAELTATRERGCAIEEEETVAGVACIAISLTYQHEPLAGISVSVPVNRFPAERRRALINAMQLLGQEPNTLPNLKSAI
ncbi:MAG: IclR family transcriptional regulator [Opitutaceae bacterium]|nr:IclR family transcriptional regulator [Opitutaceae bacterium]|tara:strand:+ start:636 stop:1373 length:738 start_codon:yes stop_codon:yes gene_type:complete